MKSKIILIIAPALFLSTALSAQHIERTLVKSFNLNGNNVVLVDVDANVTVTEWNQDLMRVIMKVSLENGSDMMLKSLVKVGRYNLDSASVPEGMKIYVPALEKQVKLRSGKELKENIKFEIYAPSNVLIKSNYSEAIADDSKSTF